MLEDIYKTYRELAEVVDWKKYNCNELFYKYIENENTPLKENFYSAIVCRYWGYSGRTYLQCNKHIPFDQCYDIVIDAINYVLKKRVWENPESSLYGDPTGPDKAFHVALKRERGIALSRLNTEKRKTNFNTLIIDEMQENYKDSTDGLLFSLEYNSEFDIISFIETYTHNDDLLDSFILDMICFSTDSSLDLESRVIRELKLINDNYISYFSKNYKVSVEKVKSESDKIKLYNNKYLRMRIRKLLYLLKKSLEGENNE